jgi:hypothetical protein
MKLEKQLVLFRYILQQIGYENFEDLRDEFNKKISTTSATGYTVFASSLMANSVKKIEDEKIKRYDEAIQIYEKQLRDQRAEPFFGFKYYQWFSLFFSEYFLDTWSNDAEVFINELNQFIQNDSDFSHIEPYKEKDLRKLAYWMATGSGKTLIMHCNYWQIIKYVKEWENIILITPNEGLSRQHYENLTESGIPAKLYSGSEESLKTKAGEILILEITKLVKEKEGQGVSVDVDYFSESKNLVFIDEGHKGQKSEERAWKNLREHLTRGVGSFTFEYSATFGQVISTNTKDLLQEYGKSIVFDYSYRHFYSDGYGKDFKVFNLDTKNEYSEDQHKLLMTASLLGYYEQLALYEKYEHELRPYNIEKPLWIFVGSKVQGKVNQSDVSKVVHYFRYALSSPDQLQKDIEHILSNNSGLRDTEGNDIFSKHFDYLKQSKPTAEDILLKVFHGIGQIEGFKIKQADGEIALKTKSGDQYFAVINIGDAPKYAKTIEADTNGDLAIQDDNFTTSLFQTISKPDSGINILIGSKKFIEGWNSWRVSSMGLMNMGKSEGAQIIQLFGRGVRLKGKDLSLKREEVNAPYYIRALQSISIMGLNASYMNRFLDEIEKEVPEYTEYPIKIKFNREDKWNGQIMTFQKHDNETFKNEIFELSYERKIAERVTIDLRNKISVAASGFNSQIANNTITYDINFLKQYFDFIDINTLVLEVNRYKLIKGYANLLISSSVIQEIIKDGAYKLYSHPDQFGLEDAISEKIQRIVTGLLKDYLNKFYADREKGFLSKHLTYDLLDHKTHHDMFPSEDTMIIKIPKKYASFKDELENSIKDIYDKDSKTLPSIHFDKHLYSPIASIADGEKFKEIKTIPTRLNEGERNFLKHLKEFVKETDIFENKELFVLRNLSIKGIGFFMESSSFYPDFILWVIDGKKQHIYFLDPKGILLGDNNFNNSKILWCRESAPELGKAIQKELEKDEKDIQVEISAFILSNTDFNSVRDRWSEGSGTEKEDFTKNNVLFIEDNKEYLSKIFSDFDER